MKETKELRKKVYKDTIIVAACISLISVFIIDDFKNFIIGIVFGTGIGMLNFTLLALTVEKMATMSPRSAQIHASSRYFLRYVIYGLFLYVAIKKGTMIFFGGIVGLLLIKIVIYTTKIVIEHRKVKKKQVKDK